MLEKLRYIFNGKWRREDIADDEERPYSCGATHRSAGRPVKTKSDSWSMATPPSTRNHHIISFY
jgi:hypothetical protein